MSGVAIIVVFLVLAGLMIARRLPALFAVPLMALGTAACAGIPAIVAIATDLKDPVAHSLAEVIVKGSIRLAPVYATLFFGALLSRVVLSTGIAETLVTYAAEFGGDRPLLLSLLLCIVTAVLFTTVTGLGAIIMIGTIVLPVMMTVGVPRVVSATLFLLAFGLGYILNISQWKFYSVTFGVDRVQFQHYAWVLFAVQAAVLVIYALAQSRSTRGYATKVEAGDPPRRRVGPFALITPILPLILLTLGGQDPIVAFIIASIYGVLVTRPRAAIQTLLAAWVRGIEDVAPATILMIGIGMLLVAATTPQVQAAVTPIISAIAPRTPLTYVLLFGLLSPLALYRGPLNPLGIGIGVYTILLTLHVLPPVALVAAIMAVVQVQNVCDPTNTQNVWVANFTGISVERITRALLPWQVGVATIGVIAVVVAGGALFGAAPFPLPAAAAAELPNGLTAPVTSANVIAVQSDGTADGRIAADTIAAQIRAGGLGFSVVRPTDDPTAHDCARKPYAAVLRVDITPLVDGGGSEDVGLSLLDCAGWNVDEWHEQGDPKTSALAAFARVLDWRTRHAQLAQNVFARGVAYDPAKPTPTFFYVLFKPSDGYLRALVRTGGPAYAAGMRTGDIIDTIDDKVWWMYGTYQSELRAYDGKPHTFDVRHGGLSGPAAHIVLGEPFSG